MDLEKKLKQTRKACGFSKRKPSQKSLSMRPNGKGWMFVQTEDGKLAWIRIRKLTPRECFRLQGLEDCDIDKIQSTGISNSQQYKLAGNSIAIPCLYHLFRKLFVETGNEKEQMTLF